MPRASRAHDFTVTGALLFVVWLIIYLSTKSSLQGSFLGWVICFMPLLSIFGLGMYALSSVLMDLATFKDCPQSTFVSLQNEIADAKKRLRTLGVKM